MFRIERHVDVPLRPLDVWGLVADVPRAAEWDPAIVTVEPRDTSALGQGKVWKVRLKGGRSMTFRIARFDPPRNLILEGRGLGMRVLDDVRIERHANGTRIRWVTTGRMSGPLRLTEPFVRLLLARHLATTLARLARWLEANAPRRSAPFRRERPAPAP